VVATAHNEEANIEQFLRSICTQRLQRPHEISEIVVVASGCSDRTVEIVNAMSEQDPRVRLVTQTVRMGKAAAINAYLRDCRSDVDVIVLSSSDVVLQPGCLDVLLGAFLEDPGLGMVGARPRPVNDRHTVVGAMFHFLWELHHERACQVPKLGETVAIRAELMQPLDEESAVDEASMEAVVAMQGYRLRYLGDAVVANRGPDSFREYFEQRRRVAAGHYWLRRTSGYSVSTLDWISVLKLALRHFTLTDPKRNASHLLAIATEAVARGVGYLDVRRNHSHAVWRIAESAHKAVVALPEAETRGDRMETHAVGDAHAAAHHVS
jgi:cellulose synthase/poly-beta-1,6-N-acetylglucosamine synthase-like glycosyltransferase